MNEINISWSIALDDNRILDGLEPLIRQVPGAGVFCTPEWFVCATKHLVPVNGKMHVLSAWNGSELLACIPVVVAREFLHGVPMLVMRLLGDPLADRTPLLIISQSTILSQVLDALQDCPDTWDIAILNELPFKQKQFDQFAKWIESSCYHAFLQLTAVVPILDLHENETDKLLKSYSRTLRTRLRRSYKRLEQAGTWKVKQWQPKPDEIYSLLVTFKQLEDVSWKGQSGVGIFSTTERFNFFLDLSMKFSERGYIEVATLELDKKLISYRYGFRYNNTFYDYNLAFLPDFNRFSPGRILLSEIITNASMLQLEAVDASRTSMDGGHLLSEWPVKHLEHYQMWIFAPHFYGRLARIMICTLKPWAKKILRKR